MVIVTTAVYKVLAPLNWGFKYLHWAGITDYSSLYRFAISYVFEKQLRWFDVITWGNYPQACISPKILHQFAKFLWCVYTCRRGLLSLDTCVGYWYESQLFMNLFNKSGRKWQLPWSFDFILVITTLLKLICFMSHGHVWAPCPN